MNTSVICVTTQRRLDRHESGGHWLRLSQYGDMEEFHAACTNCFPEEPSPQLRYSEWYDVPDELIREDRLSPNLFEALDTLAEFDEEDRGRFLIWCRYNGYDVATDDLAELSARYLSIFGDDTAPDEDPPNDEIFYTETFFAERLRRTSEIFGDDYD